MSDSSNPTPPSTGSGAASPPSTAVRTCTRCCCCVVDANIRNVRLFTTTPQAVVYGSHTMTFTNGHAFDFVMQFNYLSGPGGVTDCSFEWNERVNLPAHATHPANTWTEMYTVGSPTSPIWIPWTTKTAPCPGGGNLTVTFTDPPSLGNQPGRTIRRTLEFRLVARSNGACGCGVTSVTCEATQVLVMVNGVLDTTASSFTIGTKTTLP